MNQFKNMPKQDLIALRPWIAAGVENFQQLGNQVGALTYKRLLADLDKELKKLQRLDRDLGE